MPYSNSLYRPNGSAEKGITFGGTVALGLGGWATVRLYTRQKVVQKLEEEGFAGYFGIGKQVAGFLGQGLNLPPPTALAKSMVPLWSTITPHEALYDISRNGRSSKYWPDDYRTPSLLAQYGLESVAFASLARHSIFTQV